MRTKYGRTARERILSRLTIDRESGCLLWTGPLDRVGYGHVAGSFNGSTGSQKVHRIVYRMLAGPIPDGMELDHLCLVKHCASPAHLEPVTHSENIRRMHAARRAAS